MFFSEFNINNNRLLDLDKNGLHQIEKNSMFSLVSIGATSRRGAYIYFLTVSCEAREMKEDK